MPGVLSDEMASGTVAKGKKSMAAHDDDAEQAARKAAKKAKKAARRDASSESESESEEERAARKAAKKAKKAAKRAAASSESSDTDEPIKVVTKKQKGADGGAVPKTDGAPVRMSAAEFRKSQGIVVTGGADACPDPIQVFEDSGYAPELLQAVKEQGFSAPSGIQSQCWPIAMQGKDLIAVAKTGSGKTCGFLFPAFHMIQKMGKLQCRRGDGPMAVVLAPTRELAVQIEAEAVKFAKPSRIVSACCYGGMPKGPQIRTLMMGIHVLIATPGRMMDFLKMKNPPVIPLNRLKYVVFDEADRMLDMGFEPQIREILDQIPKENQYQSLMFTATWPKAVERLAASYLKNPVQINIGGSANELTANKDVTQVVHNVDSLDKDDQLIKVMGTFEKPDEARIIVFANKKYMCDRIVKGLAKFSWKAVSIHGDKDQYERTRALDQFTKGNVRVIVATDVAARGLDIKGVTHVVNYDFPDNGTEDWVHRVGRTGRAGAKGIAHTFFDVKADKKSAKELCTVLKGANQVIPDFLAALGASRQGNGKARWNPWQRNGGRGGGGGGRGGGGRGRGGGGRGGGRGRW